MRVDLHLHSTASDGRMAPADLAAAAGRARLVAWALTDHDTIAGYSALAPARPAGLVPGIEISCWSDHREIHVLGLGFDPADAGLADLIAAQHERRRDRLTRIVDHLGGLLPDVPVVDEIFAAAIGTATRSHLARLLVARRLVPDITAAFVLIGDDALASLPPPGYPTLAAAAMILRRAGGVALLAHPGHLGDINLVERLAADLDGIEARHHRLPVAWRSLLDQVGKRHGWLVSCGSDTHGPEELARIGTHRLSRPHLDPLLRRLARWLPPQE